jgi:hypothetical protein
VIVGDDIAGWVDEKARSQAIPRQCYGYATQRIEWQYVKPIRSVALDIDADDRILGMVGSPPDEIRR